MFIGRVHLGLVAAVAVLIGSLGVLGLRAAWRHLDASDTAARSTFATWTESR